MSAAPATPLYRITLFYGPDRMAGEPWRVACVFNVKKRSWKGGVQITVELQEDAVAACLAGLEFGVWLASVLTGHEAEERGRYSARAEELLIQELALLKLHKALEEEVGQHHTVIPASPEDLHLVALAVKHQAEIRANVLAALDLSGT